MNLFGSKNSTPFRILVINEDEEVRRNISAILDGKGHLVREAPDPNTGLKLIKEDFADLVFLESRPGPKTMKDLVKLKEFEPSPEVIITAEEPDVLTAVEAMKRGAGDYIPQPLSKKDLLRVTERLSEKRKDSRKLSKTLKAGQSLGKYRITKEIGAGAMASVYLAIQAGLDKKVVIKILHHHLTREPKFIKRFEMEARLAASLSHPNLVEVYDFGRENELYYIVMEYVMGKDLESVTEKSVAPDPLFTAAVGIQLCGALKTAHGKGIMHRDLKPANVLISNTGTVKLTDFGLASGLESETLKLTSPGEVVGTPMFMSPEQVLGEPFIPASDIFSLGGLMYYMATGQYPFQGSSMAAVAQSILACDFRRPGEINPDLPAELSDIILKCLAREKEYRFKDAGMVKKELERFIRPRFGGKLERLVAAGAMED